MRRINLLLCLAAAAALLPLVVAGVSNGTLPDAFASWTARSAEIPIAPAAIAVNAQVLQEYGLVAVSQRTYLNSAETLEVTLYRLKDPTGAYGFYSYMRTPEVHQTAGTEHMPDSVTVYRVKSANGTYGLYSQFRPGELHRADITEHSSLSPTRALILQGSLVLDVEGKNLTAAIADLKALAEAVAPKSDEGPYPTLYGHLPQTGYVNSSDRYILGPAALREFFPVGEGDWLGFGNGVEAEVANYRINGQDMTLLIADFPTPQTAIKKMEEWANSFNVNGARNAADRPAVYVKRSLTIVGIVYHARSQADADAILNRVHAGTELTWNEPSFSFTDPNMGTVIVGIIYGTGILCMFALIAGLAFGGFRLAVKRLLPGRIFDRSAELDVLQLGLGSKPINSDDFYGLGRITRS